MISQLLFGTFNRFVDPLIERACGDSKTKEFLAKGALLGVSFGLATFGGYETVCYFSYQMASITFGSIIMDNLGSGLYNFKELVADKLDRYDLDHLMDTLDPIIDITAGVGLRQLAGCATSIPLPRPNFTTSATGTSLQNNTEKNHFSSGNENQSLFAKIGSGISSVLSIGQSSKYNESNLISNGLDLAGGNMVISGLFKLVSNGCSAVLRLWQGDKVKLSVYDIKSIIKAQGGDYDRAQVKAQAEHIYAKIEQSEKYYESFSKRPNMKKSIDIVSNLYRENFGPGLKEQYGSALSNNPKLLAKSYKLVDTLMKVEVTSRLIDAREAYSKIIQFKQYGISMPEEMRGFIKDAAQQKLAQEANSLNATEKEKQVYKNLFSKTAEIEIEFAQLSYLFMAMQQEAEFSPEFANA